MQNLPSYSGSLARFAMGVLTSLGFFVFNLILIIPAVIAIVPVGAIMSYLVARRITRRIERLALAASGPWINWSVATISILISIAGCVGLALLGTWDIARREFFDLALKMHHACPI